jgi:hypothetical protein
MSRSARSSLRVFFGGLAGSWFLLVFVFFLFRLLSIALLYTLPTPTGGRVTEYFWNFANPAFAAEAGTFFCLAGLFGLLHARASPGLRRGLFWIVFASLVLYAVLAEGDAHIRRWMGLRVNLTFIRNFLSVAQDSGFWSMLGRYVASDAWAIAISFGLVLAPAASMLWLERKRPRFARAVGARLCLGFLLIGALAMALSFWLAIAKRKWRLIAPVPYNILWDLGRQLQGAASPPGPAELASFRGFTHNQGSSDAYPAWRVEPDSAENLARFRARPLEERPDVLLVVVESMRGWITDWRSSGLDRLTPNLAALFRERGVAFSRAHSNGYPSNEGLINLHLGVWSHPTRAIAIDFVSARTRSLPEILTEAGYASLWLTASDPSFDNLQHSLGRWFEHWEYHEGSDLDLARRVIERYDARDRQRPLFFSIYTASMHPPYSLPATEGPRPREPEEAYLRALAFTDRALGQIFEHLRRCGTLDRTILIVVGDHAQPSDWHYANDATIGLPNAGRTWTSLLIAAPGLPAGTLVDQAVSHVDVAPTLLGLLGLRCSHHFLGQDLFGPALEPVPVLAAFNGGLSVTEGADMTIGEHEGRGQPQRFRYDLGPLARPLEYGHGERLEVRGEELETFQRAQRAMGTFLWMLDTNRLCPPRGAD